MRIAFLFISIFLGIHIIANVLTTASEYKERQTNQLCKVDPNICK
jgi:hypothetical protein